MSDLATRLRTGIRLPPAGWALGVPLALVSLGLLLTALKP
jgi:hypothetical protein